MKSDNQYVYGTFLDALHENKMSVYEYDGIQDFIDKEYFGTDLGCHSFATFVNERMGNIINGNQDDGVIEIEYPTENGTNYDLVLVPSGMFDSDSKEAFEFWQNLADKYLK